MTMVTVLHACEILRGKFFERVEPNPICSKNIWFNNYNDVLMLTGIFDQFVSYPLAEN
jgi:hypothetical protein